MHPELVALSWKIVEHERGKISSKEKGHWEQTLRFCSPVSILLIPASWVWVKCDQPASQPHGLCCPCYVTMLSCYAEPYPSGTGSQNKRHFPSGLCQGHKEEITKMEIQRNNSQGVASLIVLFVKSSQWRLERPFRGYEHWQLFQRTLVPFPFSHPAHNHM